MTIFHIIKWPPPDWPLDNDLDWLPSHLEAKVMDECYKVWNERKFQYDPESEYSKQRIFAEYKKTYIRVLMEYEE